MLVDRSPVKLKETRRIVAKGITLLLFAEEGRFFDHRDAALHRFGPYYLVEAEHDALAETGIDRRAEVAKGDWHTQRAAMLAQTQGGRP